MLFRSVTVLVTVVVSVPSIGSEGVVAFLIASVMLNLSCANTSWNAQRGMDVAEETVRGYLNEGQMVRSNYVISDTYWPLCMLPIPLHPAEYVDHLPLLLSTKLFVVK